jgi:hypothetical protein
LIIVLKEEHRLKMFEKMVLRRIFGPKRIRKAGHATRMGDMRNAYIIPVGNPDGVTRFRRPMRRWDDGKIVLKCIFRKCSLKLWTAFNWLRIGSRCGIL